MAWRALDSYDVEVVGLEVAGTDWNCTFRVETSTGDRYQLRLYRPNHRSVDEIVAELGWLGELADVPGIQVPHPIPTRTGSTFVEVVGTDEHSRRAALFTWLPGELLGDDPAPDLIAAFGRTSARLHQHGANFSRTGGLRIWDESVRLDEESSMHDPDVVSPSARAIFREAAGAVAETIGRLQGSGERPRIVHGDLHQENVLVHDGRLSVIDFDDCTLAWPVQDLGVTMWEIGEDATRVPYRKIFREGYESCAPWPEGEPGQVSLFAARRGLVTTS